MSNRKCALLFSAVVAAVPATVHAVTITFQFDLNDIQVCATSNGSYVASNLYPGADLAGTTAAPVLTVPPGTFVKYGLDAEVTNNGGLGIAAFTTGVNNSTGSATSLAAVQPAPTVVNPFFNSLAAVGVADGMGGIGANFGTTGSYIAGGTTSPAKTTYAASIFAELYSGQRVAPSNLGGGSFQLAITDLPTALQYIVGSKGTTTGTFNYRNKTIVAGTDVVAPLPVLTINYGEAVPEPATAAGLFLGTTGLLLYRRKSRIVA